MHEHINELLRKNYFNFEKNVKPSQNDLNLNIRVGDSKLLNLIKK